jgi:2'-5' RNA ligase
MAARIGAHVTLVYEFVQIDRVRAAANAATALRLRIGGPARWEAEPGIYLPVSDRYGDLQRFRAAAGATPGGYVPHVTILHRDSVTTLDRGADAWAAVSDMTFDVEFNVREIVVYDQIGVEGDREVWRETARLALGSS